MVEQTARWAIFVSLVSLFLFTLWAAYELFTDPTTIPFEPLLGSIVSLLTVMGAWFFQTNNQKQKDKH